MEPRSGTGLGYNDHGPPEIEGLNSVLRLVGLFACLGKNTQLLRCLRIGTLFAMMVPYL